MTAWTTISFTETIQGQKLPALVIFNFNMNSESATQIISKCLSLLVSICLYQPHSRQTSKSVKLHRVPVGFGKHQMADDSANQRRDTSVSVREFKETTLLAIQQSAAVL